VSDCSGNGRCEYINANTNKTVAACTIGDVTCTPVCRCNANFYGVNCAVKYEDMVNKQGTTTNANTSTINTNANANANSNTTTTIATRVALLSSLKAVADKLDVDPLSAKAVLLSLSSLTKSPEELSLEAATIAGI